MKRRRFLTTAFGAGAAAPILQAREAQTDASVSQPLPPAIAALKSRHDEAKPITKADRAQRWERARQLMQRNGIDAICMIGGTSLVYFAGIHLVEQRTAF
jgi:Xaa-Pro dipeptidase